MKNKGFKTVIGIVTAASMLAGNLTVPMAAEEDAFVSEEAAVVEEVAGSEVPAGDLETVFDNLDAEFEDDTISEEADVAGLDELIAASEEADEPAVAEEEDINGDIYTVSADALGEERTYYGFIPMAELPVHHDVEPSEEMALGAGVSDAKYISPYWSGVIKDQGYTGNCWAFATAEAIAACVNKKTDVLPSISWKNMSYWNCRKSDLTGREDSDDYIKYEYSSSTYKTGLHNCTTDDSSYFFSGGSGTAAGILFAQDRCIKDNTGSDDSSKLVVGNSVEIANGNGDISKLFASNTPAGTSAATNYRIPETYLLGGDSSNIKNIKAMIVEYGAGTIAYYPAASVTNPSTGAVYNSAPPAGKTGVYSSHQITVVGWDDNYATSNFLSSNAPKQPGAWICANSWGEGASSTKNGITYISYYDDSIIKGGFSFHDVYVKGDAKGAEYFYDNNYGVNGVSIMGTYASDLAYALAYKAKKAETIEAISVFTYEDDAKLTISVLGNPAVENGCVDLGSSENTPLTSQTESIKYAGMHTIKLKKPVAISSGQSVIVCVDPEKTTTIPVTYTDSSLAKEPVLSEKAGYYAGHLRAHAVTSLKCLREANSGTLNLENRCDNYIRILTNDGADSSAVSFTGTDFDISAVEVASSTSTPTGSTRLLKTLTAGGAKYQIYFTGSPVYTGKKHVVAGSTGNNALSADLKFDVYRNGVKLSMNDYKLKFKNNKYPSGYKDKNPQVIVKLGKGADKVEKKELKKQPVDFPILPGNMSDVKELKWYKNILTGEITKFEFKDAYGNKLKFSYARSHNFKLDTMAPESYVPKTKKDVELNIVKYNGKRYAFVFGNGVTVKGWAWCNIY